MEEEISQQVQEIYDQVLTEILKAIGKLEASGLTETDIGDLCEVSQPTINRIKSGDRGKVDIPFRSVLKLAIGLKIDLAGLLFASNPDKQAQLKALLSEIDKMIANR